MSISSYFLNDPILERFSLGQTILRFAIVTDSGVPSFQSVAGVVFPHLLEEGKYDGINANPNTILNQTNIDNFLGEAGVVDDAIFQFMPNNDSTFGWLFKFNFNPEQVFLTELNGNNNKLWDTRRDPTLSATQTSGLAWNVYSLSAGGFAYAARFQESNLTAPFRNSTHPIKISLRLK